jgi:hypothetical protein
MRRHPSGSMSNQGRAGDPLVSVHRSSEEYSSETRIEERRVGHEHN